MEAGAAGVGSDSGRAVGLLGGQEERELPVTLPEVVEDEEQDDSSDPYSTWHALYGTQMSDKFSFEHGKCSFCPKVNLLTANWNPLSNSFHFFSDPFVTEEVDDHLSSRWAGRSPRSSDPTEPQPKGSPKKRKKRKRKEKQEETGKRDNKNKGKSRRLKQSSKDCHVEKREMRVRDLGLGFDSDEIVLFKFCVGTCQSSRGNYDLALKKLLENGSLPRRRVSSHPCCRPDRYESVSFMDAQTTWRTIQSLSAASCMCMGWRNDEGEGENGDAGPEERLRVQLVRSPVTESRFGFLWWPGAAEVQLWVQLHEWIRDWGGCHRGIAVWIYCCLIKGWIVFKGITNAGFGWP